MHVQQYLPYSLPPPSPTPDKPCRSKCLCRLWSVHMYRLLESFHSFFPPLIHRRFLRTFSWVTKRGKRAGDVVRIPLYTNGLFFVNEGRKLCMNGRLLFLPIGHGGWSGRSGFSFIKTRRADPKIAWLFPTPHSQAGLLSTLLCGRPLSMICVGAWSTSFCKLQGKPFAWPVERPNADFLWEHCNGKEICHRDLAFLCDYVLR